MSEFRFNPTLEYAGTLEVGDPYDCAIEALDSEGMASYLVTSTSMGETRIWRFGPFVPDSSALPDHASISVDSMRSDAKQVAKAIASFLNPKGAKVEEAREVSPWEALASCADIVGKLKEALEEKGCELEEKGCERTSGTSTEGL